MYLSNFIELVLNRWAQEEVGVALGELTEGSIELGNQDVKKTDRRFVTRVSGERIQKDNLIRRLWESDPVLHYEATVGQVIFNL